jgi:hypothetical protein
LLITITVKEFRMSMSGRVNPTVGPFVVKVDRQEGWVRTDGSLSLQPTTSFDLGAGK